MIGLFVSGTTGIRTWDTRIFSPLLYQLSYSTATAKIHQLFSFGSFLSAHSFFLFPTTYVVRTPMSDD